MGGLRQEFPNWACLGPLLGVQLGMCCLKGGGGACFPARGEEFMGKRHGTSMPMACCFSEEFEGAAQQARASGTPISAAPYQWCEWRACGTSNILAYKEGPCLPP